MEKITGFMYSVQANAIVDGGNIIQVINTPLPSIPVQTLPTEKSFSISFCIVDIDKTVDHVLRIVFKHKDETIIDFGNMRMESGKTDTELFLNVDIRNVVLREAGEYETELEIDDRKLGQYPINIHLALQQKTGGQ